MRRRFTRTIVPLAAITILFYWKTLLTRQFSLITHWEGVNQAYAWMQFTIHCLRQGTLPLWDPFTSSGHSFVGEMQTSGLSPLNLLLVAFGLNGDGLLPLTAYHWFVAFLHFLGLAFGFALGRELGMKRLGSLVTGMCFSFGGFVAHTTDWPDLVESAIWLPLVLLFLIRALGSRSLRHSLFYAGMSGLAIGLAALGGRLHMVILQALFAIVAAAFFAGQRLTATSTNARGEHDRMRAAFIRSGLIVLTVGAVAVGAGALQLFPSLEYAPKALRWVGDQSGQANHKIPYALLNSNYGLPQSVISLLFPFAFNGSLGPGEYDSAYIGVFPLLLAIVGVAKRWQNPWVRFSAFLVPATILYSFGPFSPLHGWLYVLAPKLWMVRQASRMLYLGSFGLALLAGFGADVLFSPGAEPGRFVRINRASLAVVALGAGALAVSGIFNLPLNSWEGLSIVLIFAAYGMFLAASSGKISITVKALAVLLILFDLSAFDWTSVNRMQAAGENHDELARLLTCRNAVRYLRSLTGPFRVDVAAEPANPNIGDAFHILTNSGAGATALADYMRMRPREDLLDVRYVLKPASAKDPDPVFRDQDWKIYRTGNSYPHAWLVHQTIQASVDGMFQRLADTSIDYRRTATTTDPLSGQLDAAPADPAADNARFTGYHLDDIELSVESAGRSLLVVSEMFDSEWRAKVNGRRVPMYRVDGALRGVVVPNGPSQVVFEYVPISAIAGGILTALTFLGMLGFWLFLRRSAVPKQDRAAEA